ARPGGGDADPARRRPHGRAARPRGLHRGRGGRDPRLRGRHREIAPVPGARGAAQPARGVRDMTCEELRPLLLAYARGTLPAELRAEVAAHLPSCPDCARLLVAETALDDALGRLPQHAAPLALKRRLREAAPPPRPPAAPRRRGPLVLVGTM